MKREPRKAPAARKKVKRSARAPKTMVSPRLTTFAAPEHDPLADSRLRPLVERYAALAGAKIVERGAHLAELRIPAEDRRFFGGRDRLLVAFSVSALEQSPEAEMALIGSPFVEQMLSAIRARGARLTLGLVPPGPDADAETATLSVPVKNGTAAKPKVRVTRHPVGRLLARVLVRAGATVEEHLVESGFFDLAAGAPLPPDVTAQCVTIQQMGVAPKRGAKVAAKSAAQPSERPASARSAAELVRLMTADLESTLGAGIERLRSEAERALAEELARIDKYYRTMLEDVSAKETDGLAAAEAGRAIEAEHARRRLEEERRHQVRAVVHPLQMVEMEMVVQRAEWVLSSAKGEKAKLAARRYLGGPGGWSLSCPGCAQVPSALILCGADQVGCDGCARQCAVCGDGFRVTESASECHVDGAHVCAAHLHTCSSCERTHCTTHETRCAEGGHAACTSCVVSCAGCGRMVCTSHAVTTGDAAPSGSRRLCGQCVVHCEGRRNEPVGRDEAVACASCERFVCERHQVTCVVDERVHCSTHLARTDHSRALVCEAHRGSCHHEPEAILASSEVSACPVCGRSTCTTHLHECASCGRLVCVGEWEATSSLCGTCRQLAPCGIPSEVERAAAKEAAEEEVPKQKHWRVARDLTHQVFELTHGGQRRTVFALPHGESRAETVVLHGLQQRARKR